MILEGQDSSVRSNIQTQGFVRRNACRGVMTMVMGTHAMRALGVTPLIGRVCVFVSDQFGRVACYRLQRTGERIEHGDHQHDCNQQHGDAPTQFVQRTMHRRIMGRLLLGIQ
ncbi:MAG: hypothetical protein C6Y20_18890 [Tagaea sp. CACIAM 22H2]|nr:hypothetical protein [Tagaea sp. CACIAM 22H2]